MLCQECNERSATLHFTKIINGEKTEIHICEKCAKEKGDLIPGSSNSFSIHNLLSGLLEFNQAGTSYENSQKQLRCENCGLTYHQFRKVGRFGCSQCYTYFSDHLDPLFRRVHGTTTHVGKVPSRSAGKIKYARKIDVLKKKMQSNIENEQFEEAAQIRDQIKEIEQKLSGM
ncbi:UvrB/UvrC motif-containing protein [Longirhabdus pacifica]|uniref:UvrB/UvrC motif-containing protein n=1 Tax=Longirhabdus pacifica TaxID=2305227 RepID=UPI00100878DC|nr:UvrB/UvrC motif-containing protein [Longirhabdus pacifica]